MLVGARHRNSEFKLQPKQMKTNEQLISDLISA